jgi:ribosomal protein S18 acetylase RimI-like enzyme
MKNLNYKISKLQSKNDTPLNLLLLADETIESIEKYIYDSDVYVVTENQQLNPIAVIALYKINNTEIEIKNIAVSESLQGKGIGSYLVSEIKRIARRENFNTLIVGTPDCSYREIKFYEKNGFTKFDIKKDFFVENYSEPIIENGIVLRYDNVEIKSLKKMHSINVEYPNKVT